MMSEAVIYILIGQKGSGKTYIGNIVRELYGITFIRVEDIALKIKQNRAVDDESYHKDVFAQIESHIRSVIVNNPIIIFESLGLTPHFDNMLENLKGDFRVICINVKVSPELCLERIKNRDKSIQIDISDEEILKINSLILEKNMLCDYEIENNESRAELIPQLNKLFVNRKIS